MATDDGFCITCGGKDWSHLLPDEDQRRLYERGCVVCDAPSSPAHALCPMHQAETERALRAYVPALIEHLEGAAGPELDAFIEHGRFAATRWWVGPDLSEAARSLARSAFRLYADDAIDARLLYGERPPADPWDFRPYLCIKGWEPPDWFLEHAAPILERAIREVFSTLPTEPVEREVIREATAGRDSGDLGSAFEFTFGYLSTSVPPLSEPAGALAYVRYGRHGTLWDWFGWDAPDAASASSGRLSVTEMGPSERAAPAGRA
jgi:hypothetical protein